MKYRFQRSKWMWIATAVVTLHVASAGAATETSIEQRLDQYFQLIDSAPSPTDLVLLKNASDFWLKGVHGQHPSVARFFQLHEPQQWRFSDLQQAGDYAAITVAVESLNYAQPWLLQFELLKSDSNWMITDYRDVTLRPYDDTGKSTAEVVMAYLDVISTALTLRSNTDKPDQLQRIKRFYEPGAGFWKNGAVYSVAFMLWLEQQTPKAYALVAVDDTDVSVSFSDTRRGETQIVRFGTAKEDGHFFINQYTNLAAEERRQAEEVLAGESLQALAQVTASNDSSTQVVQSQLDILASAGKGPALYAVMSEVAERSQPLWLPSKSARSSLGRLIGIYAGLSTQTAAPRWTLTIETSEADRQVVVARPQNPQDLGAFATLLDGIRFQTIKSEDHWKIEHAVAIRHQP